MTIAIVKDGEFRHTTNAPVVNIDGINRRTDGPLLARKTLGMYDFIPARLDPPVGKKALGTTFLVDHDAGTVTERFIYIDMTQAEIKDATNTPLDQQIDALERQQLLPRITRDMHKMATLKAAEELGITEAQLLDEHSPHYSPGYARFHAFDSQIAALRAQRI